MLLKVRFGAFEVESGWKYLFPPILGLSKSSRVIKSKNFDELTQKDFIYLNFIHKTRTKWLTTGFMGVLKIKFSAD
jgi:hypothetical protein